MTNPSPMQNDFLTPRLLGRSGLVVGRLGLGSSYGAPAGAYEEAFEHGCNYFYWGSVRRKGMGDAIRHIASRHRDRIVVVLQSYSRNGFLLGHRIESGLRGLRLDYADILLLGYHSRPLSPRLMDAALRLQQRGRVRHLAVSGHHRPMFQQFARDLRLQALMLRYNAAHRGTETEAFPHLERQGEPKAGVVCYTASRWGTLIDPRYTPIGLRTPTAVDCYRFVLSNPDVDVCLTGPETAEQMAANLKTLQLGPLSVEEMQWMRKVGDNVHRLTARSSRNPFMQREQ
jgi:aryl-alcohol dehydrogenase-like predicted oxidoreductase